MTPSILLLFLVAPLYADIDADIDAIQKASTEKRFKLMNTFKKEVMLMQEEERIDAITKLKSITQSKHTSRALKELKDNTESAHQNTIHTKSKYEQNGIEDRIEDETEDHIENETEDHIEDEHDDNDD